MGQVVSQYVFEQKRYSKQELKSKFDFNDYNEVTVFIKKLKQYGILKMVKNTFDEKELSDLTDDEIEMADIDYSSEDYLYVFTFVGLLAVGDRIIKCMPKYLKKSDNEMQDNDRLHIMKQVIKVIEKCNSKKQLISFSNEESNNGKFSMISMMLYLLNDYYMNGIYFNKKSVVETNGEGEILWDNTINDTFAIISNGRPYYLELQTKKIVNDDEDYFRRLHMCILTECSKKLGELQLLELFDMDRIELTDEELDTFGNGDYIAYRIEHEKSTQFITQKQQILDAMETYIKRKASFSDSDNISIYGSNSFNLVWEKVCGEVFKNKLNEKIRDITLEPDQTIKDSTLISIIEKPKWIANGKEDGNESNVTLRPDLISIYSKNNENIFGIFDAKYYNILLNKDTVKHQPGIQDVTKQYLYQLAYKDFIAKYNFKVVNTFLFPSDDSKNVLLGKVKLDMFGDLCKPELQDILVVKLSASKMYEYYINNKKIDISQELDFI